MNDSSVDPTLARDPVKSGHRGNEPSRRTRERRAATLNDVRRYLPREVFFTFAFAFFAGFASLPSCDAVALAFFFAGISFNPFSLSFVARGLRLGVEAAKGDGRVALTWPP